MIDYQIEDDVLGYLLLKPKEMEKVVISDNCFLDTTNRFIFNLIKKQYSDSKTIDIVTIVENYKHLFSERFKVEDIVLKMTNMINEAMPSSNFDYYQETMFSRFIKYKILESVKEYQKEKITTDELLDTIHKYENMSIKTTENHLNAEQIYKLINSKNKNINFRFSKLSKYSNIQEHDFVVIAARTGLGKTGFILNFIEDLSDKYTCVLFNMEMSEKQLYQRLVSINTSVPMQYHDNPKTEFQNQKILDGCKKIANKKIKVINNSQTISSIRRKIIKEAKDEHILVFIDYVGLIHATEKNISNYERITSIVKELRRITLDYNCTIFLVSQINRNSENQKDKLPKISDLKESGELEQSATTVLMLHDENNQKNTSKITITMQVIIGKNRNGKVGIIPIQYNRENQRYDDIKETFSNNNEWRKE